jgi:hypothetical protein
MTALYIVGYLWLAAYLLFIFYLAVMNLKRVKDTVGLSTPVKVLGYPILFIGLLLDFIVNVFLVTFILMELPRELTVTSRFKRHNREGTGWRQAVARWFEPILDPFDPSGDHI